MPPPLQLAYEKLKETLGNISEDVVESVEVEALGGTGAATGPEVRARARG